VALAGGDAEPAKHGQFGCGFESCSGYDRAGLPAEFNQACNQVLTAGICVDFCDQAAAEFDDIGLEQPDLPMEAASEPASFTVRRNPDRRNGVKLSISGLSFRPRSGSVSSRTTFVSSSGDRSRNTASLGSRHRAGKTFAAAVNAHLFLMYCGFREMRRNLVSLPGQ
jgi:hypothetical protein